ncbi:helix-turn-helix transcriptional regulator [Glycomyces sp. TRM65418]|uniref:helix-turn-helix transcriptional regulator n=1 Tax=Glycomyces sp. TRM65418 TaxID=2867006 RepID=UPI001CE6232F|nr:helix-turn-helix transcriptional regulator [Glycomyces sp. TRM65418]MCC3765092.1 helix-turn-helix transcriptional regulator [Glycomyces sp. TRM65418]QZD54721.1 helix-turn-helix transcriptional regulator [Glycomyces sp. TRM65418]
MDRRSEIADFLRSRRARLSPGEAGLPDDGRVRRVPGLRRDEVARLASMSVEYYTRLEQGRAGNPSPEIIEALAEALRLDRSERDHLQDLFGRRGTSRRAPIAAQRVRPGLLLTLQSLESVPAFIIGRRTDVLAANRLARAVLTDFEALPAKRRNLARFYLLDPAAKAIALDWERMARDTVAMLRFDAGRHPDDRQLAELLAELEAACPEFGEWWNDHQVLRRTNGTKRYAHPVVGEMEFQYEAFEMPGDPDQYLCVYNVEPGSASAEALRLLDSWTAPAAQRR